MAASNICHQQIQNQIQPFLPPLNVSLFLEVDENLLSFVTRLSYPALYTQDNKYAPTKQKNCILEPFLSCLRCCPIQALLWSDHNSHGGILFIAEAWERLIGLQILLLLGFVQYQLTASTAWHPNHCRGQDQRWSSQMPTKYCYLQILTNVFFIL